jgi:hypothetical protein
MNDYFMQEAEQATDEQELAMLAEYHYKKTQGFIDWIYENRSIGNGDMLLEACEDTRLQEQYIRDAGLPSDTILEV